jgi:low affinity Fe/Cu permease
MVRSKSIQKSQQTSDAKARRKSPSGGHGQGAFARIAVAIAHAAGKPVTFLTAAALVILWAVSGPVFGFSDTWQLVINTSTTIITFLMVFLIQNTQNRDTAAIQIKLDELILRLDGADKKLTAAEDMSDEELERLHHRYMERAESARKSLDKRRSGEQKAA